MPDILERLRGTSVRIENMIHSLSEEQLTYRPDSKWSIKEHIGHLGDLEELHAGRIKDFQERAPVLRAADMSNAKTVAADHNQAGLEKLLTDFADKREILVSAFEHLSDEDQLYRAMHPRLQVMVRPVDIAFFTAEHDDHHLADIREILHSLH